jgi:membrane protease YdiL (CAAX protease family)
LSPAAPKSAVEGREALGSVTERVEARAGRLDLVLAAEFAALFLGLPLVMALAVPADWMWPVLFGATALALVLLARTPGFSWSELLRGWRRLDWGHVALVGGATAAVAVPLVLWLVPGQALFLPRRATGLWLAILAFYPFLSALPQELVFRPLFFRRYGGLFPDPRLAIVANAAVFGLAHLMFWNWVAVAMCFAGGLIFAHAYLRRGGFALAVVLHALCGVVIFTSGLGTFFYHGAVPLR